MPLQGNSDDADDQPPGSRTLSSPSRCIARRRLICFQFALDPGVQLPAMTALTAMTAFRL
jgi:hypothetical protein